MNRKLVSLALLSALALCACSEESSSVGESSSTESSAVESSEVESSVEESSSVVSSSAIEIEEWPDKWKDDVDTYTQGHSPAYYDPGIDMTFLVEDYSDYSGYGYDYVINYVSVGTDGTYDMVEEYAAILLETEYFDYSTYYGVDNYYVLEAEYSDGVSLQIQLVHWDSDGEEITTSGYGYFDVYIFVTLPAEVYTEWPTDEINKVMSDGFGIENANIPAPSSLGSGVSVYDYAESYGVVEITIDISSDISSSYSGVLDNAAYSSYFKTLYDYGIYFEAEDERFALYFGYDSDDYVFYIDIYEASTFAFSSDLIAEYFYSAFGSTPSESIPSPLDVATTAKYVDYYTGYLSNGSAVIGIYVEEDIVDNYVAYLETSGWTNDNGKCYSPEGDYWIQSSYYTSFSCTWVEIHYLNA